MNFCQRFLGGKGGFAGNSRNIQQTDNNGKGNENVTKQAHWIELDNREMLK